MENEKFSNGEVTFTSIWLPVMLERQEIDLLYVGTFYYLSIKPHLFSTFPQL